MKFQDENEIIKICQSPKNSDLVLKGRKYESRLRLFTEAMFQEDIKDEDSWKEFKAFMSKSISSEKEIRLNEFIRFPLSVVNITESMMSDLYKVFDAGNSYFNTTTVKKNGGEKIEKVLSNINIFNWMETKGKEALRSKPNMIVVIDKDEEGNPYIIDVDNDRLIDFDLKEDKVNLEYIIFLHSEVMNEDDKTEKRYSVYDEESYIVVLDIDGDVTIEKNIPHGLDHCPARMFLKEGLYTNSKFSKKSPIATALSKLEEWQLFDIYKFYTDHYAPFPVVEMVRSQCGNDNCLNGQIFEDVKEPEGGHRRVFTKCETCSSNNIVGPGSKVLIDPQEEKDQPTASGKFKLISNTTENLEYLQSKLEKIEKYVKSKVVGVDDIVTKEAVNEVQMEGAFESKTNVLMKLKTNLDELYVWIVETIGELCMPGKPLIVNANFGTEWYLMSEEELQGRLKLAIESGFPKEEIDMIYHQLIETKYKGNPDRISRIMLIHYLDPCPFDKLEAKVRKFELNIISQEELVMSERLLTFVHRFELENGSILEFGSEIEEKSRIEKIVQQLKTYANESKESEAE